MLTSASNNRAFVYHLLSVSTLLEVSSVCVLAVSNWTKLAPSVSIMMNVWTTLDVKTDARFVTDD